MKKSFLLFLINLPIYTHLLAQKVEWIKEFKWTNQIQHVTGLEVSSEGSPYLTTIWRPDQAPYSFIRHSTLMKFSPAGEMLWEYRDTTEEGHFQTLALVDSGIGLSGARIKKLDVNGNIIFEKDGVLRTLSGFQSCFYGVGRNYYLTKYSSSGEFEWEATSISLSDNCIPAISKEAIFATSYNTVGGKRALHKFDMKGNLIWSREIPLGLGPMVPGPEGSIFVLGAFYRNMEIDGHYLEFTNYQTDCPNFGQTFVGKINPDGIFQWISAAPIDFHFENLTFSENIYVTGFNGKNICEAEKSLAILEYDASTGELIQDKHFDLSQTWIYERGKMIKKHKDHLYVAGILTGPMAVGNVFIAKINLNETTAIESKSGNINISAFPNPASGEIFIEGNISESILSIHNHEGRLVKQMESGRNRIQIDTSDLAPGTYYISVKKGEAVESRKVVIGRRDNN